MLYRGLILCFASISFVLTTNAQQAGTIEEKRDSLIAILQKFRADNEINPTATRTVSLGTKPLDKSKATRVKRKGFRVQIYSGSNRTEAYAIQGRFRNQYSDIDTYINYDEPNYRVKVGDFTSRSEANSLMKILKTQYKNVFVFSEDIWVWQ